MDNADFHARMDRLTERHEALTQSMELTQREIVDLKETARLLLKWRNRTNNASSG